MASILTDQKGNIVVRCTPDESEAMQKVCENFSCQYRDPGDGYLEVHFTQGDNDTAELFLEFLNDEIIEVEATRSK